MSYDIYLVMDTGAGSYMTEHVGGPTFNFAPMFDAAIGMSFRGLDAMSCKHALPILRDAVADMERDPAKYRKLDSPNGWGTYDGGLGFLTKLRDACAEHPLAKVRV